MRGEKRCFVSKIFRFHLKEYMRQLKQGILGLFYFTISHCQLKTGTLEFFPESM